MAIVLYAPFNVIVPKTPVTDPDDVVPGSYDWNVLFGELMR